MRTIFLNPFLFRAKITIRKRFRLVLGFYGKNLATIIDGHSHGVYTSVSPQWPSRHMAQLTPHFPPKFLNILLVKPAASHPITVLAGCTINIKRIMLQYLCKSLRQHKIHVRVFLFTSQSPFTLPHPLPRRADVR